MKEEKMILLKLKLYICSVMSSGWVNAPNKKSSIDINTLVEKGRCAADISLVFINHRVSYTLSEYFLIYKKHNGSCFLGIFIC